MNHVAMIGALLGAALMASAQEGSQEIKPQKEHQLLKQFEGEWDVQCKWMIPGEKAESNAGTETAKLGFEGFWLVSDFKGEFAGKPFEGHSMIGFDPQKKQYVALMIGNGSPYAMKMKGTGDTSGKKFTMTGECVDPKTGKNVAHRMECEVVDKNHRTERIFITGEDGKETLIGEFTYTRKGRSEAK